MSNTFLGKLYRKDIMLFLVVTVFLVFTLITNLFKVEMTPFFLWGMYSKKENLTNRYSVLQISINDDSVINYAGELPDNTRFFLTSPAILYQHIIRNRQRDPNLDFLKRKLPHLPGPIDKLAAKVFNDSTDLASFPGWYAKYLEEVTGQPVFKYSINNVSAHFDTFGYVVADSSHTIIKWQNE